MSLFDNTDKAFEPFYDEDIVVEVNGSRQTVKCFVSDDITQDPISENMMDTTLEGIQISFRKSDYVLVSNVKRGDRIYRSLNNKNYRVKDVKVDYVMGFIVTALAED